MNGDFVRCGSCRCWTPCRRVVANLDDPPVTPRIGVCFLGPSRPETMEDYGCCSGVPRLACPPSEPLGCEARPWTAEDDPTGEAQRERREAEEGSGDAQG